MTSIKLHTDCDKEEEAPVLHLKAQMGSNEGTNKDRLYIIATDSKGKPFLSGNLLSITPDGVVYVNECVDNKIPITRNGSSIEIHGFERG